MTRPDLDLAAELRDIDRRIGGIVMRIFFSGIMASLVLMTASPALAQNTVDPSLYLTFKNPSEELRNPVEDFQIRCGAKYPPCNFSIKDSLFGRAEVFFANLSANKWNWLEILDHPDLSPFDNMTLSAWIFPSNHRCSSQGLILAPSGHKIVGKTNARFNGGYVLGISTNQTNNNYSLFAEVWDSKGKLHRLVGGQIPFGRWTHVAVSWRSGGAMKGYVNGVRVGLIKASQRPIGRNKEKLRIGIAPWDTNALAFGGGIDEIRLYRSQLKDHEMKMLYERTFASTHEKLVVPC